MLGTGTSYGTLMGMSGALLQTDNLPGRAPIRSFRSGIWIGLSAAAIVLGFLWYIGVFGGNVHAVVEGRVYRSAQLTGRNLEQVFASDRIRTDINLRGGSMRNAFYRNEVATCRRYGVTHIDITLSATHLPSPAALDRLLATLDTARYPVLFHCQAGADRTGLACTLYLIVYRHVPEAQAESEELTWRYGHFGFGQTHAMNDFFKLYDRTNGGLDLRDWILTKYPSVYSDAVQE